jgi:glycosyltransferase involved in cell wall biosynthesis
MGSYNPKADWFERALDSANDLFDEIVIVDDGSDANLASMICPPMISRIKIVRHKVNKGFWAARNTGIECAHGDIICSLDDDDYFERDAVVALKKFVRDNSDGDIFHFILRKFNQAIGLHGQGTKVEHLKMENSIPSQSWFKKSVWSELGGYKKVKAEDWNFWVRCLDAGKKFKYFPEVVYNLNVRNDSLSRTWGISADEVRREVLSNL